MAPLPQNSTTRYFFDYVTGDETNGGVEHTFQVRAGPVAPLGTVMQAVTDFLNAMGTARFYNGWKLLRARVQAAGSNFSSPVVIPPGLTTFEGTGGDPDSPVSQAIEVTFQGRSPQSGRRVDLSLYGVAGFPATTSFRVEADPVVYPWLSAAVAALTNPSGVFVAIDFSEAVWYPYMNWQYNSYWERRIRSGV